MSLTDDSDSKNAYGNSLNEETYSFDFFSSLLSNDDVKEGHTEFHIPSVILSNA